MFNVASLTLDAAENCEFLLIGIDSLILALRVINGLPLNFRLTLLKAHLPANLVDFKQKF